MLVINNDVVAPEIYPPEPTTLAVVIDKKLVLELSATKLKVSVVKTRATGVV